MNAVTSQWLLLTHKIRIAQCSKSQDPLPSMAGKKHGRKVNIEDSPCTWTSASRIRSSILLLGGHLYPFSSPLKPSIYGYMLRNVANSTRLAHSFTPFTPSTQYHHQTIAASSDNFESSMVKKKKRFDVMNVSQKHVLVDYMSALFLLCL